MASASCTHRVLERIAHVVSACGRKLNDNEDVSRVVTDLTSCKVNLQRISGNVSHSLNDPIAQSIYELLALATARQLLDSSSQVTAPGNTEASGSALVLADVEEAVATDLHEGLPVADDVGGLTKDLFTCVWNELVQTFFIGESAVIPFLPVHEHVRQRHYFPAIGRILCHTAALLSYIPARISRSTLLCLALDSSHITDDLVMEDLRLFLPIPSRVLVDKALSDFSSLTVTELNHLTSVLGTIGMLCQPTSRNIKQVVAAAARHQMLDVPMPFITQIRSGIPDVCRDTFWSLLTVRAIEHLFREQLPTPSKVSSALVTANDTLSNAEENCLFYLRQFVREMDQEDLTFFLHFITGSTVMPSRITVTFTNMVGALRSPVVHTCTNTLELPSTYVSLQDLKREFMAILREPINFQMDIA